jgi:hypothetical protein
VRWNDGQNFWGLLDRSLWRTMVTMMNEILGIAHHDTH